jgi:hypothetical protein
VAGAKIQRCVYATYIGLTINQGSNAVLKAEGFVSDESSEVEKLKPVCYCSDCNEEANIKNPKWCASCGMVVLSFSGYQEALEEQKHLKSRWCKGPSCKTLHRLR